MPNGAGEKFRWGDRWEPPFSTSTRKGWVPNRPLIRPSVRTGAPSPQGEGFGGWEGPFPSAKPPLPARPAGGRAVTGVGSWAAGQAEKKRGPPQGPPSTRKGGSREEETLPPWCSFLRLSSKERRAPARGRAGNGALRPEVSEKPRPPKGYAVPPSRSGRPGPHQTAPSFFAQFCATFLPPPCTPACNFGPGSPGGERRFCHAHPP